MKKYIGLFCAVLICLFALCGCGKDEQNDNNVQPDVPAVSDADNSNTDNADINTDNSNTENNDTDDTDLYPVEEQEEIDKPENQPNSVISEDKIRGTYWKAVRFEGEGSAEGGDEMPMGSWDADLFLNDDGTGRFRNTYGASYNYFQPECEWSFDEGTSRILLKLTDGTETYIHGLVTENGLRIDYNEGDLWFDQAEMPAAGGEWCLADLVGTWKLEKAEIEGDQFSAEEMGIHGSVSFSFNDPELNANYVWYDDFGNRTEIVDAMVVYLDMPLVDGCVNETWCVELIGRDDNIKCYAAVLDRETMMILLETYEEGYEYPAVSVQYFHWEGTGSMG